MLKTKNIFNVFLPEPVPKMEREDALQKPITFQTELKSKNF